MEATFHIQKGSQRWHQALKHLCHPFLLQVTPHLLDKPFLRDPPLFLHRVILAPLACALSRPRYFPSLLHSHKLRSNYYRLYITPQAGDSLSCNPVKKKDSHVSPAHHSHCRPTRWRPLFLLDHEARQQPLFSRTPIHTTPLLPSPTHQHNN